MVLPIRKPHGRPAAIRNLRQAGLILGGWLLVSTGSGRVTDDLVGHWRLDETAAGEELVSGAPVPVGGPTRLGPLSAGLNNNPVGAVRVYGATGADLFLTAGQWSNEPGLFLYRWAGQDTRGAPFFGERARVSHPGGGGVPPEGTIFEARDGTVYGFWLIGGNLVRSIFNRARLSFDARGGPISLSSLPRRPERVTVLENPDGSLEVIFSVSDGVRFRPPAPPGHRDPEYRPFDGAGIWRGGMPYVYLMAGRLEGPTDSELSNLRVISQTQREVLLGSGNLTSVRLGPGRSRDLVTGSRFGNLHYYRNDSDDGISLAQRELIPGEQGNALRHPTIRATPIAYPDTETGFSHLIAGGEGGLYFYRFLRIDERGRPVYDKPSPVLEKNADLYPGSLPVLNAIDWDGDGIEDIVAGNSEGKVLFFQNRGTHDRPDFLPAVEVAAGGVPIHVQQGYTGIQGPGEARWGYSCPTAVDWNGDGLPDIVMHSATQRHKIFLNEGTVHAPRLRPSHPVYWDGLELHGTWRVQPAVGLLDGRMAYVTLDGDDEFRLFWRIDDWNVEDGGKLRLADGSVIRANFLHAGGTGRLKLVFADWDQDGIQDLLVGTPRHGSVPNPETGLPQSKGLPGSAVLWLRNEGTNAEPVFAFPKLMHFRGQPRYFHQHACSPAATAIGGAGGPHLFVGDQEGRIYFFHRDDISWGD